MIRTIGVRPMSQNGSFALIPVLMDGSSFYISNITGIDSPKSSVPLSSYLGLNSSVAGIPTTSARNMVMTIDLVPDFSKGETYESIRDQVYSILAPNNGYRFVMNYDDPNRTRHIDGYVESADVEYFTATQNIVVSIICPKPYFSSQSVLTFSAPANSGENKIGVIPTAQTRFSATLRGPLTNPVLTTATGYIRYGGTIGDSDTLQISTLDGGKTVTLSKGGDSPKRVYGDTSGTIDQYLGPGRSEWVKVTSDNADSKTLYDIRYQPQWLGV